MWIFRGSMKENLFAAVYRLYKVVDLVTIHFRPGVASVRMMAGRLRLSSDSFQHMVKRVLLQGSEHIIIE